MSKTTLERFWEKVDRSAGPDSCHLWTAARNPDGYGTFWFHKRNQNSHRVAWQIEHGPISAGQNVLHECDTPGCVNHSHLFLGTQLDNMRDMEEKGRSNRTYGGTGGGRSLMSDEDVERLKAMRASGMTMQAIGDELGVTKSSVSKILLGQRRRR